MQDFSIEKYTPSYQKQLTVLMDEFCIYIEDVDDLKRTSYKEQGAQYFIHKMLEETRQNNGKVYIAKKHDSLIGFIGGYVGKQSIDEQMEAIPAVPGIINEFFVTSKFRSKGVGFALIQAIESYLHQAGCDIVRLEVFAPNTVARDFYKRNGYTERLISIMKLLK